MMVGWLWYQIRGLMRVGLPGYRDLEFKCCTAIEVMFGL